jgi:hypothetical protein
LLAFFCPAVSQQPGTNGKRANHPTLLFDVGQGVDDPKTGRGEVHFRLPQQPVNKEAVTVLPLALMPDDFPTDTNRASQYEIQSARRAPVDCGEGIQDSWAATAAPTKTPPRRYFSYLGPIPVLVIYPAVPFARQFSREELAKEVLPQGVALANIETAADLDRDGHPDLLVATCCGSANSASGCKCETIYQKNSGGWTLIRRMTC